MDKDILLLMEFKTEEGDAALPVSAVRSITTITRTYNGEQRTIALIKTYDGSFESTEPVSELVERFNSMVWNYGR